MAEERTHLFIKKRGGAPTGHAYKAGCEQVPILGYDKYALGMCTRKSILLQQSKISSSPKLTSCVFVPHQLKVLSGFLSFVLPNSIFL